MTLSELLDLNARKFGDKVALIYGENRITFGELKQLAEKSAAVFQKMGVKKGSRVSIMSFNTPSFVLTFRRFFKTFSAFVLNYRNILKSLEIKIS